LFSMYYGRWLRKPNFVVAVGSIAAQVAAIVVGKVRRAGRTGPRKRARKACVWVVAQALVSNALLRAAGFALLLCSTSADVTASSASWVLPPVIVIRTATVRSSARRALVWGQKPAGLVTVAK
jgi:hypothetical protein